MMGARLIMLRGRGEMGIVVRWDEKIQKVVLEGEERLEIALDLAHELRRRLQEFTVIGTLPDIPLLSSITQDVLEKLELFEAFGVLRLKYVDGKNLRRSMSVHLDEGVVQGLIDGLAELPPLPLAAPFLLVRSGNSHWPRMTQRLARGGR